MFGFLGDLAKGVGEIVGSVTGSILGVSTTIISETLKIPVSMVNEAVKAGCTTYEEVKDFHKL